VKSDGYIRPLWGIVVYYFTIICILVFLLPLVLVSV